MPSTLHDTIRRVFAEEFGRCDATRGSDGFDVKARANSTPEIVEFRIPWRAIEESSRAASLEAWARQAGATLCRMAEDFRHRRCENAPVHALLDQSSDEDPPAEHEEPRAQGECFVRFTAVLREGRLVAKPESVDSDPNGHAIRFDPLKEVGPIPLVKSHRAAS